MEDEEDIFVGDMVTCVVRVVRENELKEGVTAKQVLGRGGREAGERGGEAGARAVRARRRVLEKVGDEGE